MMSKRVQGFEGPRVQAFKGRFSLEPLDPRTLEPFRGAALSRLIRKEVNMAAGKPRVAPVPREQWDDEVREILQATQMGGRVLNIFQTLAQHPKLLKRWLVFGNHVLFKST